MKYNWNQLMLQRQPAEQAGTEERRETERAQAIRARANRLYLGGELARAAHLLMELEMRPNWVS